MKNKRTLGFEILMIVKALKKEALKKDLSYEASLRIQDVAQGLLGITTDANYQKSLRTVSYLEVLK